MNIEINQASVPKRSSRFEAGLWRAAAGGMWIACSLGAAVGALGVPTGLGAGVDVPAAIALNAAALALVCVLFAWLFRICRWQLPALTIGSAVYSVALLTFILYFANIAWPYALLVSSVYLGVGAGAGWLAGVLFSRRHAWRFKLASLLAALVLLAGVGYAAVGGPSAAGDPWTGAARGAADKAVSALADSGQLSPAEAAELSAAEDPSLPGPYAYSTFTYGSGTNRQRAEFGSQADLKSAPADASAYIGASEWPWQRKLFWGFGRDRLPLNGTVWMPEGDGPFPVVLIVHGNHSMEDFSDEGYAYLGELLASRGFAAVSVDENFLNYSVWSGIPNQDQKVRAWLLLKHIGQLQQFASDASTPLYGKLDFERVALVGHSRGGQAVAMAADRGPWFGSAPGLPAEDSYTIRAVVALAPTDVVVDGRSASLRDIAYLLLQGAGDGDISNFDGERQYNRVSYSPSSAAFKSSLYIAGANHGQFNTTWGARDDSLPAGLFLSKPDLSGEEQRQIAKVYVSAFLESALHGQDAYEALFRDYRAGAAFLPAAVLYNQFENGSFQYIARFENADDKSRPSPTVTAGAAGMTQWSREEAKDRQGRGQGNHGVELQWEAAGGSYTLESDAGAFPMPSAAGGSAKLIFSMADLTWELNGAASAGIAPRVSVTAEDAQGQTASVPLDRIMPVQPAARTKFTWLNGLDRAFNKGKYEHTAQAAFQTYEIPLDRFVQANPELEADRITRIAFVFADGPGRAMLDDIGFGH
ncbi:alpha/beta hydrolase [Cohnella lubricantis]|uniref:Alpha/beta hydrolase n=1 Tax=Cohnella lubricantis TaxID=2163172 RepID=A0A841TBS2_9BACL|nr:alpha/beta hydrolase [Cohnella lubricantis]MBB6676690.1 alpha/beta hydrolase [Cohnella lubricantis]MBP2117736.1 dienelactone hydrolase [Cohnella lubricantis]